MAGYGVLLDALACCVQTCVRARLRSKVFTRAAGLCMGRVAECWQVEHGVHFHPVAARAGVRGPASLLCKRARDLLHALLESRMAPGWYRQASYTTPAAVQAFVYIVHPGRAEECKGTVVECKRERTALCRASCGVYLFG